MPQRHELGWTRVWAAIGVCPGKVFKGRWLLTFDHGRAGCARAGSGISDRGDNVQRPWGAWSDQRNCGAHLRKIWPGASYQNAYNTNKITCATKKGLEIPRRKLAAVWQGDGTLLPAPWYHGLLIYLGLNGSQVLKEIKFMCLYIFICFRTLATLFRVRSGWKSPLPWFPSRGFSGPINMMRCFSYMIKMTF